MILNIGLLYRLFNNIYGIGYGLAATFTNMVKKIL